MVSEVPASKGGVEGINPTLQPFVKAVGGRPEEVGDLIVEFTTKAEVLIVKVLSRQGWQKEGVSWRVTFRIGTSMCDLRNIIPNREG